MNRPTRVRSSWRAKLAALVLPLLATALPAQSQNSPTLPPGAEVLQVPAGNKLTFRAYAIGVQVYRCDPVTLQWTPAYPYAQLYVDPGFHGWIGFHTGGPTWMTIAGSAVVGERLATAIVDPTAIPWLLLAAESTGGPGPLAATTFIQRVNTVGGLAPGYVGSPGEIAMVPYTAQYLFYRAQGPQ